jgi:hypothetical protein
MQRQKMNGKQYFAGREKFFLRACKWLLVELSCRNPAPSWSTGAMPNALILTVVRRGEDYLEYGEPLCKDADS